MIWIPFVMSMLLGRSFDMNQFSTCQDIFSAADTTNPNMIHEIPAYTTSVTCELVESEQSKRDLLNIGAEISITANVKAVGVSLNPSMEYLKDKTKTDHSVEYVCRVTYTTIVERLAWEITPITGWTTMWDKRDLGTHYVRSIRYGGEMIASFNFKANTDHDIERIAGALKAGVVVKGIGVNVGAKFDRFTDDLNKKSTIAVKYYSTTPISSVPSSLEGFQDTVNEFVNEVKKVNGGKGIPIEAEIRPLSELDAGVPAFLKNQATQVELQDFTTKLQDLMQADQLLQKWAFSLPPLTDDQETQVGRLSQDIAALVKSFFEVGERLDFTQGPEQVKPAMDAFNAASEYNLPNVYTLKVRHLMRDFGFDFS